MMNGKDTKLKNVIGFVGMIVIIALVGGLALLACKATTVGQSTMQTENTIANDNSADTSLDSNGETDQTALTDEKTSDEVVDTNNEKTSDEAVDTNNEETSDVAEEDTKKLSFAEKLFGKNHIKLGLDLQGGVNIVYEAKLDRAPTEDEITAARTMIQKRLDAKGYTEAEVSIEGSNRIRVDIPGVEDPQKAIDEIGAAGMLRFVDSEGNEILTGSNVSKASAQYTQENGVNKYAVGIEMDAEGTKLFDEFTANHIGETIFILLDETLLSYPTIQAHITDGKGSISGNFDADSAKDLAESINAGALPFALEAIQSTGVGAKLGLDALNTSLLAGGIGFILIIIFMVVMYRLCGVAADIALVLYVGLLILVLSILGTTLTLPGIAGILLSIGMAVDANVIIFVRIKEEIAAGKTVRTAVKMGFDKAFSAIIDGNITTLIASVVLYIFGTGLIRSFATTLGIGIVVSMFTALVITRFILNCFIGMNIKKRELYAYIKKQSEEA